MNYKIMIVEDDPDIAELVPIAFFCKFDMVRIM